MFPSSHLLSVVIPTRRRPEILRECLKHLEAQTAKNALDVIIVHDGEDDAETAQVVRESWKIPISYTAIPKSQQGVARNRGTEKAMAPHCLYIGDDILLEPDACERHLAAHTLLEAEKEKPAAVLGYITWDPSVGITPAMRWLEKTGWQFGFPSLELFAHGFIPTNRQHSYSYASHISLPTSIARAHPFREDIALYGWEDMEWGLRLRASGTRLFYESGALALHRHRMTLEDSLRRMEEIGKSAVHMERIVPELRLVPTGWKRRVYGIATMLPTMRGKHTKAFLRGLKQEKIE